MPLNMLTPSSGIFGRSKSLEETVVSLFQWPCAISSGYVTVVQDAVSSQLVPVTGSSFSCSPPETLDRCLLIQETALDMQAWRQAGSGAAWAQTWGMFCSSVCWWKHIDFQERWQFASRAEERREKHQAFIIIHSDDAIILVSSLFNLFRTLPMIKLARCDNSA